MSKDSYWRRWRRNHAAARALALASSSDDEEIQNLEHQTQAELPIQNLGHISHDTGDNLDEHSESDEHTESDFGLSDTILSSSDGVSEIEEKSLREQLAAWSTKNRLSKTCVDDVLKILCSNGHTDLPKDSRTLLKTPKLIEFVEKCGGQYIYFGMKDGLKTIVSLKSFSLDEEAGNSLKLNFNVDGIPLFKSTGTQFWPILCSLGHYTPFVVAIFYGSGKPNCLEDYLSDFVKEMQELSQNGFAFKDKAFNIIFNAFICDAPARAFLKNIKGHTGYNACERCIVRGYWKENRVVLHSNEKCPLRTDEDFSSVAYDDHQNGETPLTRYNVRCVTGFALDYMHVVCLGVVKRILFFLRKGPRECKLSSGQVAEISNSLVSFAGKLPSEFARQPRTLFEVERWKATEFRQFLLYTGPIVLRKVLPMEMYNHFLALTVSISILLESKNEIRSAYLGYAESLLECFVKKSQNLYTDKFVVYNVHSLIHLPQDCRNFACSLNDISAFPYENHLQTLKKTVKNAKNPIVQVAKRIQEKALAEVTDTKLQRSFHVISTKLRNSCFLLNNGCYAFVKEKRENSTLVCDILEQSKTENYFSHPCESKLLNIAFVRTHQRMQRRLVELTELNKKVVCLPVERGHVLLPMLHSLE